MLRCKPNQKKRQESVIKCSLETAQKRHDSSFIFKLNSISFMYGPIFLIYDQLAVYLKTLGIAFDVIIFYEQFINRG